jgi:hypothetical protein
MAEEKAADATEETPSDSQAQLDESAENIQEATESVDELRERIRTLEAKSTKSGRSHAKEVEILKKDLESKAKELDKAVSDNRKWIERELKRQDLTDIDRRSLEQALGTTERSGTKGNAERDMWRAIATEEDPKIRAALVRRAERGKFLDADAIEDLRADLTSEDDDEKDSKGAASKKEPPKVGVRTAGTVSKSLDSRIADAKKTKDRNGLWEAMVEKARADAANRRG